jgi:lipopolysaccharide transport system permease protein
MKCLVVLYQFRRLIWELTLLQLKLRYAGSYLGVVWVLAAPLAVLMAYVLLFDGILRILPSEATSHVDYGMMIACALLPWAGFSDGILRGSSSVLSQRNLLKSQVFPAELLPVVSAFSAILSQLAGTCLVAGVLLYQGRIGIAVLFLPVMLIVQLMFTVGISWMLACINVLVRDISPLLSLGMVVLMLLSPIAYTSAMVPSHLQQLSQLNPLGYFIEAYRSAMMFNLSPSLWTIMLWIGLSLGVLQVGYLYFMRMRKLLPDYL